MSIGSILNAMLDAILGVARAPLSYAELAAKLDKLAADKPQRLDWRNSIVDLMKLVGLDSGLAARKQLAQELGYTGALDGSAEMNIWLHARVMERLAAAGGFRLPSQ